MPKLFLATDETDASTDAGVISHYKMPKRRNYFLPLTKQMHPMFSVQQLQEKDHSVSNVEARNQKFFIRTGSVVSPHNLGSGWMVKTLENV